MVGMVEVGVVDTRYGVSQLGADAERYMCACLHWGWLGVVKGISAASTGGVLAFIITHCSANFISQLLYIYCTRRHEFTLHAC